MKNNHIDCDKDIYDVLNEPIVKPFNEEMKIIINNKYFCFLFVEWKE